MTATTLTTANVDRPRIALSSARGAAAAVGAAVVNLAVYGIGRSADLNFAVRFSNDDTWSHISAVQIATASILAVLLGVAVAWIASRRSARLVGWTRAAGAALAVVTVGAPTSVHAIDGGIKPLLAVMHLVAGAAFLYGTPTR